MIQVFCSYSQTIVTLEEFQAMMGKQRETLEGMRLAFAGSDGGSVEIRRHSPGASRYQTARQTIMDIYK